MGHYTRMVANGELQNHVIMSCVLHGLFPTISVFAAPAAPSGTLFFGINAHMDQRRAVAIDDFLQCSLRIGFVIQITGFEAESGGNLHKVDFARIGSGKTPCL